MKRLEMKSLDKINKTIFAFFFFLRRRLLQFVITALSRFQVDFINLPLCLNYCLIVQKRVQIEFQTSKALKPAPFLFAPSNVRDKIMTFLRQIRDLN